MTEIPLGHRLSRELSRRGNRRAFFRSDQYRKLRRVNSVDELADFLDHNGYTRTRASENIDDVADDIVIQCNGSEIVNPTSERIFWPTLGLLLIPLVILFRLVWGPPSDKE